MEIDEAPNHEVLQSLWVLDDEVRGCKDCKEHFTLVNRRHHCRRCLDIFCGKCSSNTAKLKMHGYPNEAVRVCNKCLYEAGKENDYVDRYLCVARQGLRAMMHRRENELEPVFVHLDNAFPQFLVEKADVEPNTEKTGPRRGIAIVDMASIRPAATSDVTLEITTRSDVLRLDAATTTERDLWVKALTETKLMYIKERPFEKRAKTIGRTVQARDFWKWVEESNERRSKKDPVMSDFREKYGIAPRPEPQPPRILEEGEIL